MSQTLSQKAVPCVVIQEGKLPMGSSKQNRDRNNDGKGETEQTKDRQKQKKVSTPNGFSVTTFLIIVEASLLRIFYVMRTPTI